MHQGGGRPPRRPHLQGQVRGEQAGALRPPSHAEGAPAHRHPQGDVHPGLEAGDRQGLQHGLRDDARGREDCVFEGDLPLAHLRIRLLRGEADHRPKLPRATPHRHQQAGSQPHSSSNKGTIFGSHYLIQSVS